jgi:DNA repair exonuclease SbcCD ATPase subunit
MTDKAPDLSPEAVERMAQYLEGSECCGAAYGAITLRALVARVEALTSEVEGYKQWGDDVKRLTRQLDVEMHGEEMAAQQASLCDLIGSGKALRDRVEALTKERDEANTARDAFEVQLDTVLANMPGTVDAKALCRCLLRNLDEMRAQRDAALARLGAVERETQELQAALAEANDLLRSTGLVLGRVVLHEEMKGILANWDTLHDQVKRHLSRRHRITNTARAAILARGKEDGK